MNAFGVERFEVGIREAKTGLMMNREWSREDVEQSTAWLKRMNTKGNDVYIRPAGDHGLVLVDDLPAHKIAQMQKEGWTPAAVIETSPSNYQAWVKLSDKPLSAEVRGMAAKALAQQYGGDMASADSRHYGRLAGFTNRKPKYERDGRQPYVLAHDCPGTMARAAPAYVDKVQAHLAAQKEQERLKKEEQAREAEKSARLERINASKGISSADPGREYQRGAKRLLERYGADADMSKLDWMVAKDMAKGKFTVEQIAGAIEAHSPAIDTRKAGHVDDYAMRTATNASKEAMQEKEALAKARATELLAQRMYPSRQRSSNQDRDKGMSR
jgi:hypothetical protein